ncbi:hypothetical protein M422DRAFT_251102 [Sphaerobolus stellatus SS14]|uniref:Unplaced genomic scaffold SPHSTscaffold_37, whole genome shotgun sequence n=1 Tax=Sphaerobolus stellatus (strain SS14) TaxID=990650 RepID=A0A0C9W2R7_SPHS4|nr:hypothetical protein M422DRAFT_251102 [Sphaerobolus stellatus SS14]
MSAAASTPKPPTANSLLYKKSQDVKCLPAVDPTDVRRTLAGFRGIPEFQMRRDLSSFPDWDLYGAEEKNALMKGYWAAYDKEYEDLEELWLGLYRKEKAEAEKRKSEEEKKKKKEKKKAAPTLPVASADVWDLDESIAVRHRLGKGFGGRVPLLNWYGEVDSGVKRRRPQDEDTKSGPSKRPRVDRGMAPEEVEAEKDKGSEVVPNVDKGKGKEKEPGSEEAVEETMKE